MTFHINLPFKWYLFYFGALFHALGISIYQFFCPSLLRQYSNFSSFRKDGNGQEALHSQLAIILKLKKSFSTLEHNDSNAIEVLQLYIQKFSKDGSQADVDGIRRKHGDKIEQILNVIEIKENKLHDAYYFALRMANQTYPIFRAISTISFRVGLLLFLAVIVQGTISVINLLNQGL